MANIESDLKEHAALKARRSKWDQVFELIARYVITRKVGFGDLSSGDFLLPGDIYDDTASRALNIMVSSLIGALWKNGAKTFRLVKPRKIPETQAVKEYYKEINIRTAYQMEHPKAGFNVAYQEYMTENGAFGTAGFGIFPAKPGSENLLEFQAWELKSMCICEGANGFVNKIFFEFDFTASQLVEEYGEAAKTQEVQAALETYNYEKKFRVLWIIRPRASYDPSKSDALNMPYESVHHLIPGKKTLKESGFTEMPVKVSRFYKNRGEEYGRAPAFEALPTIVSANDYGKYELVGTEKKIKPSHYLLDDGSFGGGILDTSPDGLTVLDITSRITSAAPIGEVSTVGDIQYIDKIQQRHENRIMSHFFVDRLLDLNNQTRMTLGEAQIRNEMRSESLGAIYSRQINEVLTPTIERSVGILFDAGELGVIQGSPEHKAQVALGKEPLIIPPEVVEALAKGEDFYEIEYISPASRVLRSDELRGIMNTAQFCYAYGQATPELIVGLDIKNIRKRVADLNGAEDTQLSDEEFEKEMAAYREAQAEAAKNKLAMMQADIAAKQGAAAQTAAQAQATQAQTGMSDMLA